MTHDIVIKGGSIVDGTGKEPIAGDLAIDDGLITSVGKVEGEGKTEINAQGHMVSPGFVDIHTHFDAQIGWDPFLTSVSWHGVTTALMGNCGVTFAPCKPKDRELLAGMMETVEDIPKSAILSDLAWDWEDYGGYLDSIEKLKPAVNMAGLVGHCAVRYYVMGERSIDDQPTDSEKKEIADIVATALDRGAFGFSTNRYEPHKMPDGRCIPGTFAEASELEAIGEVVKSHDALMQFVGADWGLIKDLSTKTGSRILFSGGAGAADGSGRTVAEGIEKMTADGSDISSITHPRSSGFLFGLQANLPWSSGSTWEGLRKLNLADRLKAIADPDTSEKLVAEAKQNKQAIIYVNNMYWMGTDKHPSYTSSDEKSLAQMAQDQNEHWSETFLRLSLESQGKGLFTLRMFSTNMKALEDLLKSKRVFPGLGDAGAHVSQIMDSGWCSFVLSHWVREVGLYSMGEGIRRLTSGPARIIGLKDRGVLAPGMKADVNVFDADVVAELQPELVHDFPGGAPRFIQKAVGYKTTIVNGQVSLVDGEHTGVRAGSVLRHQN